MYCRLRSFLSPRSPLPFLLLRPISSAEYPVVSWAECSTQADRSFCPRGQYASNPRRVVGYPTAVFRTTFVNGAVDGRLFRFLRCTILACVFGGPSPKIPVAAAFQHIFPKFDALMSRLTSASCASSSPLSVASLCSSKMRARCAAGGASAVAGCRWAPLGGERGCSVDADFLPGVTGDSAKTCLSVLPHPGSSLAPQATSTRASPGCPTSARARQKMFWA